MVEDRELLLLTITMITTLWVWLQPSRLTDVSRVVWLRWALALLSVGYTATVIEGFFPEPTATALNYLEHLCYVAHTAALAVWVYTMRRPGEGRPS